MGEGAHHRPDARPGVGDELQPAAPAMVSRHRRRSSPPQPHEHHQRAKPVRRIRRVPAELRGAAPFRSASELGPRSGWPAHLAAAGHQWPATNTRPDPAAGRAVLPAGQRLGTPLAGRPRVWRASPPAWRRDQRLAHPRLENAPARTQGAGASRTPALEPADRTQREDKVRRHAGADGHFFTRCRRWPQPGCERAFFRAGLRVAVGRGHELRRGGAAAAAAGHQRSAPGRADRHRRHAAQPVGRRDEPALRPQGRAIVHANLPHQRLGGAASPWRADALGRR